MLGHAWMHTSVNLSVNVSECISKDLFGFAVLTNARLFHLKREIAGSLPSSSLNFCSLLSSNSIISPIFALFQTAFFFS